MELILSRPRQYQFTSLNRHTKLSSRKVVQVEPHQRRWINTTLTISLVSFTNQQSSVSWLYRIFFISWHWCLYNYFMSILSSTYSLMCIFLNILQGQSTQTDWPNNAMHYKSISNFLFIFRCQSVPPWATCHLPLNHCRITWQMLAVWGQWPVLGTKTCLFRTSSCFKWSTVYGGHLKGLWFDIYMQQFVCCYCHCYIWIRFCV